MRNGELKDLVGDLWRLSGKGIYLPLCIWGEAGVGKSEAVRDAAGELGIDMVDLRLGNLEAPDLMGLMRDETVYPCVFHLEDGTVDPVRSERLTGAGLWHHVRLHHPTRIPHHLASDPIGFVKWNEDRVTKMGYASLLETRTVYSAPLWFPAPDTSGIVFLDEMNRSQRETRQGVFQLVLDRRIHELELPGRWIIVSANNPPNVVDASGASRYDVDEDSDKAFLSRFCHVTLDPSAVEWSEYAQLAGIEATIRTLLAPSVVGNKTIERDTARRLLGMRNTALPQVEPTPRSWTALGRVIGGVDRPFGEATEKALVEGLVGKTWVDDPVSGTEKEVDVAGAFLSFLSASTAATRALEPHLPGAPSLDRKLSTEEVYLAIEAATDLVRSADPTAPRAVESLRKLLPEGEGVLLDAALADVTA